MSSIHSPSSSVKPIRFLCPACGAAVKAPAAAAGHRLPCPRCGAPVRVPAPPAGPPASGPEGAPPPNPARPAWADPVLGRLAADVFYDPSRTDLVPRLLFAILLCFVAVFLFGARGC